MWCRPPHGFFFTSSEAAIAFAAAVGTELELAPIAIASKELVSTEGIAAMRDLDVTRIFVDPKLDPETGDVFGTILESRRPRPSSNYLFLEGGLDGVPRWGARHLRFSWLVLTVSRTQDELSVYLLRSLSKGARVTAEDTQVNPRTQAVAIGIDVGSTTVKAVVVDPNSRGYPLERLPSPPDQAGGVRARLPGADRRRVPEPREGEGPHLHHTHSGGIADRAPASVRSSSRKWER